ncbi:hypothetical protein GC174_05780 [bacterium]|nr:hypothetical protein [bacterium]
MKTANPGKMLLLALFWSTLPVEPALSSEAAPLFLAQAPRLSVQDIERQIEIRLDKVWKTLPSLPAGAGSFDFIINKDGSLVNLIPIKSSGNADFDRAAMGTIKRVIPLPNLPAHLAVDSMRLRASFQSGQSRQVSLEFAPLSFDGGEPQTSPPAHSTSSEGPTSQIKPSSFNPPAHSTSSEGPTSQIPPSSFNPPAHGNSSEGPTSQIKPSSFNPPAHGNSSEGPTSQIPPSSFNPPAHGNSSEGPTSQIPPPGGNGGNSGSKATAAKPSTDPANAATPRMSAQEKAEALYKLVNLGVVSMNAGNYKTAISKLEEAIALAPEHSVARQNLAIAYNNYGLTLKDKPAEALKIYHKAVFLNPESAETGSNLEAIITMLGKNPAAFEDRVKLGDSAAREGDKIGAKVEYLAALKLKEDSSVRTKLTNLDRVQPDHPETSTKNPPAKQAAAKAPVQKTTPSAIQKKPAPASTPSKSPQKSPVSPPKNKLDEVYSHLSDLEKKLFGKVFAQDDLISRLNRLESKSFGKTQTGTTRRRLDALLLAN